MSRYSGKIVHRKIDVRLATQLDCEAGLMCAQYQIGGSASYDCWEAGLISAQHMA
jgi:hypothetical protein